jgi:L-2,4-diaminobutyrate decarboxylase
MKSKLEKDLILPVEQINSEIFELYQKYLQNCCHDRVFKPFDRTGLKSKLDNLINKKGKSPEFLLDILQEVIINHSMNLQNPMYMGHQVPPSLPLAVMIDLIISGLNQSLTVNKMSPVLSEIERHTIKFLTSAIGFDSRANGTLTSGGSVSNLVGLFGARRKYFHDTIPDEAVIITSSQAHYSINKAARMLGFSKASVITIPCDRYFRIDINKTIEIIDLLKNEHKKPFVIMASAGSTSTGSFDDIEALADIASVNEMWLHVDGAHGASLIFSEKLKHLLKGIERADSISWDGHKMLFMPSSLGMCLFKNGDYLLNCFKDEQAPYLYNSKNDPLDLSKLSLQCTRRGDALKLWGCLVAYGTDFFAVRLEHLSEITQYFYNRLLKHQDFETLHRPEFNIISFRYNPSNKILTEDQLNDMNAYIRDTVNATGETMITLTSLEGKISLRTTIVNPATNKAHIDRLIEIIEECVPV